MSYEEMAKVIRYGVQWYNPQDEDFSKEYVIGGVETLAHIVACWLVQEHGLKFAGTGEVRDALQLDECPERTVKQWVKLLRKLAKEESI